MGIKQFISSALRVAKGVMSRVKPVVQKGIKLYQGKVKPILGGAFSLMSNLPGYRDKLQKKVGEWETKGADWLNRNLPEGKVKDWVADKWNKGVSAVGKAFDKTSPYIDKVKTFGDTATKWQRKFDSFADRAYASTFQSKPNGATPNPSREQQREMARTPTNLSLSQMSDRAQRVLHSPKVEQLDM